MTVRRMARAPGLAALAIAACLAVPGTGWACSVDEIGHFETFLDTTCLQTPLGTTALGGLGGLRLTTNGAPVSTLWDTDSQFDAGITHDSVLFPPVGLNTLARSGTGAAASLGL